MEQNSSNDLQNQICVSNSSNQLQQLVNMLLEHQNEQYILLQKLFTPDYGLKQFLTGYISSNQMILQQFLTSITQNNQQHFRQLIQTPNTELSGQLPVPSPALKESHLDPSHPNSQHNSVNNNIVNSVTQRMKSDQDQLYQGGLQMSAGNEQAQNQQVKKQYGNNNQENQQVSSAQALVEDTTQQKKQDSNVAISPANQDNTHQYNQTPQKNNAPTAQPNQSISGVIPNNLKLSTMDQIQDPPEIVQLKQKIEQLEHLDSDQLIDQIRMGTYKLLLRAHTLRRDDGISIDMQRRFLAFIQTLNTQLYEINDPARYQDKIDIANMLQQVTDLINI